jgi:hypothetical protein
MAANRLINMLNSSCGHDETAARAGQAEPAAWGAGIAIRLCECAPQATESRQALALPVGLF